MHNVIRIACLAVLLISSVQDIRNKLIDIVIPVMFILIISVTKLMCNEESVTGVMLSMLPGISVMLISVIGKGIIGFADGIIICFLGVCEGFYSVFIVILLSFFIAWIVILYEYLIKHSDYKKIVIPFVPCVTCAWGVFQIKEWLL